MSEFYWNRSSVFNNVRYLYFLNFEDDKKPKITTDIIPIEALNIDSTQLSFTITKSMCTSLFDRIVSIETSLGTMMENMTKDYFEELPFHCQKVMNDNPSNCKNSLRPNYFNLSGDPTLYLKGNLNAVKIFSWDGKDELSSDQLGPGHYLFTISANRAYFGSHKKPEHIANLQLRIAEIFYRPTSSQPPKTPHKKSLSRLQSKRKCADLPMPPLKLAKQEEKMSFADIFDDIDVFNKTVINE